MTELSVAVLVSVDERERYEVIVPGLDGPRFHGVSLSSLLDDVTLHLMETIPKESAARMPRYDFNPYVELRKIKVEAEWGQKRAKKTWKGRLAVVISKWEDDGFFEVTVPRLGPERLAVRRLSQLPAALTAHVQARMERKPSYDLDRATCAYDDFLQVLTFEADLPTILPSQPELKGKGMRKKRRKKAKAKEKKDKAEARRLIPPTELRAVGRNLTHQAMDGRLPRAFLRDDIVQEVLDAIEREGAAVLLVGPSGVGKSAIVSEVVRRLADKSTGMQDRREVWSVDGNRIISGMSYVGQWESRVQRLVEELSARKDVLFVEDLPGLVFAGRTSHDETNVAGYLEPHLTRREIRIIGECTPERLLATRDEAPGFFARLRTIYVPPMDAKGTLVCLAQAVRARAEQDSLRVEPDAMLSILGLTRRFEPAAVDPGRSVRLLERLLAERGDFETDDVGRRRYTRARVVEHFARQSGLPPFVLWQDKARDARKIEAFFARRIVAQPEAVAAAVDVVSLLEQGLNDPGRPLSSFLFIGPTGVGKTETAKALAEFLFGHKDRLVRFDMSEFMAPHTVARLIGDRFHPDGELTRRVHQQPFSVVLLDEIEKAHPVVHDALLQVLGEGRLTNAAGQTVSFANTVVIMTSNLGVREANRRLGFGAQDKGADELHFRRAAERHFRPEFFNRIDRIVPFSALGDDAILPLVERLLEQMLSRRGLRRSSVIVEVDPSLVEVLVKEGFDPRYGARSIKRILEQRLAVPLARHLVGHQVDELTIAELFPKDGDIEMVLTTPPRASATAVAARAAVRSWQEADAALRQLTGAVEALLGAPSLSMLAEERARLLGQVDDFEVDPRTERLRKVAEFAAELERLARRVDELQEHFSVEGFEEGFETQVVERRDWGTLLRKMPAVRLTHEGRAPFSSGHAARIERLRFDFAAARFLAEALAEGAEEAVLLSLSPVGTDPAAQRFCSRLLSAFSRAWSDPVGAHNLKLAGGWLAATAFVRTEAGYEARDPNAEAQGGLHGLLLEGPGAHALVGPELGLHLDVVELGPDRLSSLVRVQALDGADRPAERLLAHEAAIEAYQQARRAEHAASPHAPAPLVREYAEGRAEGVGGGLPIDLGEPSTLCQASLLRLLAGEEERS